MTSADPVRRSTYRHGNLRQALLEAGLELARAGGHDAVVLREATRRAGVAANAAYRHFSDRDALVHAVSLAAMGELAHTMEAEQATLPPSTGPAEAARARFRAVGTGYLRFARTEPGLFRAAFYGRLDMTAAEAAESAGAGGLTPFQLLGAALDDLVACGVLPAARRPGAEFLAWSAVHGLAVLLVDGPLRAVQPDQADETTRLLLDMVERGL
ncbi:TetR/AcrR family transcriptional regulator [Sinosporangium siamense]|uniref:TetR family transcriptional regulator n=1 Tax=Sinosporangium siamense TaxID=1367973 RepID=A0A919V9J8_9ACTN|nr:TetR/AcrR family transcriptional regulator [Sinosporangium siamense]GII94382.1 TetR family transcriptional regulator [Sinosporangium siamense]